MGERKDDAGGPKAEAGAGSAELLTEIVRVRFRPSEIECIFGTARRQEITASAFIRRWAVLGAESSVKNRDEVRVTERHAWRERPQAPGAPSVSRQSR